MTVSTTFRGIENELGISVDDSVPSSPLQTWYDSVRDKPIKDFSDEDLCKSCRQELFLEFIVPHAVAKLIANPLAGEMYDGELLAALVSIPVGFWSEHQSLAKMTKEAVDSLRLPDDVEPDVAQDLNKLSEHLR